MTENVDSLDISVSLSSQVITGGIDDVVVVVTSDEIAGDASIHFTPVVTDHAEVTFKGDSMVIDCIVWGESFHGFILEWLGAVSDD